MKSIKEIFSFFKKKEEEPKEIQPKERKDHSLERFVDMFRTILNVTSDTVVAAIIADNENEINYDLLNNPEEYNDDYVKSLAYYAFYDVLEKFINEYRYC